MNTAYILWPSASSFSTTEDEREAYFCWLEQEAKGGKAEKMPAERQASTLQDLMIIRAFNSKFFQCYSLGTALGFRIKGGQITRTPAVIVFVPRKVPGCIWCDLDVVEFSHFEPQTASARESVFTDLVESLRGNDPYIGSGSQVASREMYGTLTAIVRSQVGRKRIGFVTNRHVAVNLDCPNQKMFHPLPPNLGPGICMGTVEKAASFVADDMWYGVFAGMNPESFVRVDGAFIPFVDNFDISKISTHVKGFGEIGDVIQVNLQDAVGSIIGKHVVKVGSSSGLTKGIIAGYAVQYNDMNGLCLFTDFLVVGESGHAFDVEGDSGSLILTIGEEREKPRPIGIIWGGTTNRGQLKLRIGDRPECWTSGVDLGRLLRLLQLDLITDDRDLENPLFQELST